MLTDHFGITVERKLARLGILTQKEEAILEGNSVNF